MASIAHQRKETAYFKTVSQIVSEEITNANIEYTTVTGVKLSNDSSHLNVYVTFDKNPERSLENIIKTEGFVRRRLAQSSTSRKVPAVHFKLDDTFEKGRRINEILESIQK